MMKKISAFLLVLLCAGSIGAFAQGVSKYGDIPMADLEMKEYPLDKSAAAVVLFDCAKSTMSYNSYFETTIERHTRIKILKISGFDYADVELPFVLGQTQIQKLKATSYYLENGQIVKQDVDEKDMFTEKVTGQNRNIKFAFPNIRKGSVIEFSYKETYPGVGIRTWYFQRNIPVRWSQHSAEIPEMFSVKTDVTGEQFLDSRADEKKDCYLAGIPMISTTRHIAMKNLKAYTKEIGTINSRRYKAKVEYDFLSFTINGQSRDLSETYPKMAKRLAESEFFGKFMNNKGYIVEKTKDLTKDITDPIEKAKAIYKWVSSTFKYNDEDGIYPEQDISDVWEDQEGNLAEINMLLITMLRVTGLDANPLIFGSRAMNRMGSIYPDMGNMDYIIAYFKYQDKEYFLDASDKFLQFGSLPYIALVPEAYLIKADNPRWITLTPNQEKSAENTILNLQIEKDGSLTGDLMKGYAGYVGLNVRRSINKIGKEEYLKDLKKSYGYWDVLSYELKDFDNPEKQLAEIVKVKINYETQASGKYLYISPMLFKRSEENPYIQETRTYPIDLLYNYKESYQVRLAVPQDYKVLEMPKPQTVKLPDNTAAFTYNAMLDSVNNMLIITSVLRFDKMQYSSDVYPLLRTLYNYMIGKHAEPLVFIRKDAVTPNTSKNQ
jgi:hypothetical protein